MTLYSLPDLSGPQAPGRPAVRIEGVMSAKMSEHCLALEHRVCYHLRSHGPTSNQPGSSEDSLKYLETTVKTGLWLRFRGSAESHLGLRREGPVLLERPRGCTGSAFNHMPPAQERTHIDENDRKKFRCFRCFPPQTMRTGWRGRGGEGVETIHTPRALSHSVCLR